MRGTPPSDRDGADGGDWSPDRTYASGDSVRKRPMAPGPRPMAPGPRPAQSVPPSAGASIAGRLRGIAKPGSTVVVPSGSPNATLAGNRSIGNASRTASISSVPAALPERLFSGNVRRLWLSEAASNAGDLIFGAGVVIWLMQLRYSFNDVAMLLLAFAIPTALVTFFAGSLGSIRDPRRALWLTGALRVLLAVVFIAMHFDTIIPVVILLAFGLALASNLRRALRHAAVAHTIPVRARGLLASGDQVTASIMSVAGPALATLLYVLDGERIFTIAIGAAVCYLMALTSESNAEPLPDRILFQRPENAASAIHSAWEGDEDSREDAAVIAAEEEAAVWELAAPPNTRAAIADIDAGLQIVGAASRPQYTFIAMGVLALVGGIVGLLEPFYVWIQLHQAPYILGLLYTAAGVGAALGSTIVVGARGFGRLFLILGLLASGVSLIILTRTTDVTHALMIIALMSAANVFAIRGGQVTLLRHFVPIAQRAVAQSLAVTRAWLAVLGITGAFLLGKKHNLPVPTLGLTTLLVMSGISIIVCGILLTLVVLLPNRVTPLVDTGELDPLPEYDDMENSKDYPAYGGSARYPAYDESARYPAYDESARYPAYDESARYPAYDESTRYPAYDESARYPARGERRGPSARPELDPDDSEDPPRRRRR